MRMASNKRETERERERVGGGNKQASERAKEQKATI